MSGSNRRRVSKWDHNDSEALPETFHERSSARKTREPLSPSRASRRHERSGKESMVPWDREGSGARMSPGLEDWGDRHHSRSPRNDWRRSYRSRSRSRTRSRSPIHNPRRDPPPANDNRSRGGGRSAASGQQICRDFSAGRCRRGSHCQFLHPDVEPYNDSGRPLKNSSPDEWDNNNNNDSSRHRRNRGSSRYSPEKGLVEDAYGSRERDPEPRTRDTYPDRNRDRDPPPNRGETPLCRFFAAGNCRNGKRCRFSHDVEGGGQSVDDDNRQGQLPPDHKFDNDPPVWDGPTWNDVGLGENKNETTEAATTEMSLMNSNKNTLWDPPGGFDEPKTRDRDRDKWKSENGDMEMSPNPQTLPNNMSFPTPTPAAAVQQNPTGETSYEKRYPLAAFQDQKVVVSDSNSSYPGLNPTSYKDDVNVGINQTVVSDSSYPGLSPSFRDDVGINQKVVNESSYTGPNPSFRADVGVNQRVVNDSSSYPALNPSYNGNEGNNPPPMMNPPPPPPPVQQQQTVFQSDPRVNLQPPIEPFPLAPTEPPSAAVTANPNNPINPNNPVRSEQLAQLSHLTASLAQLLESRQSASNAAGVVANLNGTVKLPQYDPISDSVEPKLVQKEPHHQQQEEHDNNKEARSKKEDENDENDAGEDGKKMKESKGTRAFKFALADFVKDLLKPAWKDGQVSKDVYKTIVKKVVDKVIETQGPQVPQTKEKIDQYLSYSKPKIEKLVQAYVGKYQKGKV